MATQAQILANRSNAQKSTGPRTSEGKAIVAQNAVKHGLSGQETVITGEDLGEFEFYRERMLQELNPAGEVEASLAERIVSLSWRLKRAERLQTAAFDSLYARQKEYFCEKFEQDAEGDPVLGGAVVRDFANSRVLDRLLMYERRIEHSLHRTMAEFKRHRILQEVGPGQMWELRRALAREDEKGTEDHGQDARATEIPGVIEGARGGDSSIHTSNLELHTSPDASCKTKPIPPSAAHGQIRCNKEVTKVPPQGQAGQTKPICGQARDAGSLLPTSNIQLHTSDIPLQTADGLRSEKDTLRLRLGVAPSETGGRPHPLSGRIDLRAAAGRL